MATRHTKYDPEKRRKLPEPRYRKKDEFEELTGPDETEKFLKSDTGEDTLEGPAVKGFGLRRSKDPFEKRKAEEEEEESLKRPEYGKVTRRGRARTRKRA